MMNKIVLALGGIVICLSLTVLFQYERNRQLSDEKNRYKSNTNSLLSDIKRLQIDSTTMAVDTRVLRLTVDELEDNRAEDLEHLQKLGVQVKSLQALAKHSLDVNAPIQAELKDSVVIRDTVTVVVKTIKMDTPYLQVSGVIENNQLTGNIHLPVTLHQAVWVEHKHRFLWWRWGVKAIHQTISSDNPYVEIGYSEYITIEK
ncbi:cell division protein FtsL [Dysgonomonas alginatilytica]|uniref:Cell division protein FtsL n=1 Tax=Dysgonomonas alginatilytica TaxID=1605892 RepID=A0A2V3PHG8_9BACT|nr:cell division protein FtsL [Dysgonomonas alginatilytica]PXV57418.1 cell division protein FtsL [Dysgonomonas alginatilytica]